jgi:hypothetical protein
MTHEKIIKDSRGKIRIIVSLVTDRYFTVDKENKRHWRYDVNIGHIAPKKRTEYFGNTSIVTDAEILEAKMELYNLIKPE